MDNIHGLSVSSTEPLSELFAKRLLIYVLLIYNYWYTANIYMFERPHCSQNDLHDAHQKRSFNSQGSATAFLAVAMADDTLL
jgi:hypothetical protein